MASPDSESPVPPVAPELGIGKIIRSTFQIYLQNFLILFPVPFFVHFLEQSANTFLTDQILENDLSEIFEVYGGLLLIEMVLVFVIKTIMFSVLTLAAFDLTFGNKVRFFDYLRTAITHFFPLLMLYLGYTICTSAGLLLFIVPGLYWMAMWSVYLPATFAEQLTSGSFERSADLTEHYRWPIVVLIALLIAVVLAVYALVGAVLDVGLDEFLSSSATQGNWQFVFIYSISDAIGEGIFAVGGVIVYCRLTELKGGGMNNRVLSEVFD